MSGNTSLDSDTLPEKLRTLVATILDVEEEEISREGNLVEELGVDSVMLLEILVVLERTFGVKLAQDDLKKIRSLSDMSALLMEKAG